jgi:hypothetical protein
MVLPTNGSRSSLSTVEQGYLPVGLSSTSANLTFTNNGSTSVTVHKTSGSAAWDTSAFLPRGLVAPVTIEFTKQAPASDDGTAYSMIGFTRNPLPSVSYTDIDYALYQYTTSIYEPVLLGAGQGNQGTGTWATSARHYIVYTTSGRIRFFAGSTQRYDVFWAVGHTVFLDIAFYSVNSTSGYSNIRVINREWNGTAYV